MAKQSRSFSWEADQKKFINGVWKIFDQLGVDNPTNALRKICSLQSIINEKEETLNEYLTLTNTNKHGNAKQRILSLMKKVNDSTLVSERYGLDTTFLGGIGSLWDRNADGKDPVVMIQNLHKKLDHQRAIVTEVYEKFLGRVVTSCLKEGLNEAATRSEVERWHSAMEVDFDLLTVAQFWQKYCGDLHDLNVMPNEPHTILLYEALPLIKKYAPIQVYQELYDDDPERFGYIPRYKFDKWNDRVTGLKQLSGDALTTEKYTITAEILSEAAFRRIEGPEAILNPGEKETALRFILTHEEINPYGREFTVDDNTSFLEVHQLYLQYSGANK